MPEPTQRGRVRSKPADDSQSWGVQVTQAQVAEALRNELAALPDPDEIPEAEQTPADRIAVMLDEFGGIERAEVKLYRMDARTKALEFCQTYSPGEFETGGLDMIRGQWGAGTYQIRLYGIHPESGKFVVRARTDINIAQPAALAAMQMGAAQPQQNSELSRVLGMLIEGQQQIAQALMQRPQADPMAQMKDTLALMVTMREAMGLSGAQAQQKSSIGEIVEAIKEMRAASSLFGGESEDKEPTMMQMLPQVLSAVQSVAGAQPQGQMIQAGGAFPAVTMPPGFAEPPMPNPAPEVSQATELHAAQIQSLEDDPDMLEKMLMMANLKKILKMAAENAPVDGAIDFALDKLPDELIEALENDQWFVMLSHIAPDAAKYQEYLSKVRAGILEALKEDGAE